MTWMFLSGISCAWAQASNQPLIENTPPTAVEPVPAPVLPLPPENGKAPPPPAVASEKTDNTPVQPAETFTAPERALPVTSLLFIKEEIELLRKAVAAYERQKAGQKPEEGESNDYLSKLGGLSQKLSTENNQPRYFEYPQFYLESLAYHSPDNWAVHINQKELNQSQPEIAGLRIIAIDKDKISVEWRPIDMERVKQSWALAKNDTVTVDEKKGLVSFTLHTNQTFSSYVMRVLEGKVAPVIVEITKAAPSSPPNKN